ncbi:MAG: hypothetical protein ACE5OY_08560 [Candidatus Bathyarchaeia archaeon]
MKKRVALGSCPEIERPEDMATKVARIIHSSRVNDVTIVTMPRPAASSYTIP